MKQKLTGRSPRHGTAFQRHLKLVADGGAGQLQGAQEGDRGSAAIGDKARPVRAPGRAGDQPGVKRKPTATTERGRDRPRSGGFAPAPEAAPAGPGNAGDAALSRADQRCHSSAQEISA